MKRALAAILAFLADDRGGLGDGVMELAIIGSGAYSILTTVKGGVTDLGARVRDAFTSTTVP